MKFKPNPKHFRYQSFLFKKKKKKTKKQKQKQKLPSFSLFRSFKTIQGDSSKEELEKILKQKDSVIQSLKDALEKEYEENDEAIEAMEAKILADKKKHAALVDDLKVEIERLVLGILDAVHCANISNISIIKLEDQKCFTYNPSPREPKPDGGLVQQTLPGR